MKNSKSMLILVIIMSIISFACLTLGFAYSYVLQSFLGNEVTVDSTNQLSTTVNYITSTDYFIPLSDSEGINLDPYNTISVTNPSDNNFYYTISLKYDTDDSQIVDTYGFIPMENIRFALYDKTNNSQLTSAKSIADCPVGYHDPSNVYNDEYIVYESLILPFQNHKIGIKIWIDESVDEDFDETYLGLKAIVKEEPIKSKLFFSLSGSIRLNDEPIEATITNLITGKSVTSNLDDNVGNFLITDLYNGIAYPFLIEYQNEKYYTVLYFEHSDNKSIDITEPGEGMPETYVQASAYTYHTTVNEIIQKNWWSIINITNSNLLVDGYYNIPSIYNFKSNNSDIFSDLVIDIGTDQVVIN